jgi:hypothetical protein
MLLCHDGVLSAGHGILWGAGHYGLLCPGPNDHVLCGHAGDNVLRRSNDDLLRPNNRLLFGRTGDLLHELLPGDVSSYILLSASCVLPALVVAVVIRNHEAEPVSKPFGRAKLLLSHSCAFGSAGASPSQVLKPFLVELG